MIYCFDLDGTLCANTDGDYARAQPYSEAIRRVNALYDSGNRVVVFTARGTTTGIDWRELTEGQLKSWGVKYHELLFGKPEADVFVDDKAVGPAAWNSIGFSTGPADNQAEPNSDRQSILKDPKYLEVTYSQEKAPAGSYPTLLAEWLLSNVYRKTGRLLDLGCGRGDHLEAFGGLGFDCAGVDISNSAQDFSPHFQVRVADLNREDLPFASQGFDYVFSKSVIEHLRDPVRLLSQALLALRPGGIAVIMTPSWEHTYWGPFYVDHTHVSPFTKISLLDAMTMAGFDAPKVSFFYQLPFLWRYPYLKPIPWLLARLPIPYRPFNTVTWGEGFNKLVRFSKEVMLLGVGVKPIR